MNSSAPASQESSEPKPHLLASLLIGPDGLRSGWRALLFLLLSGVLAFAANDIVLPLLMTPPDIRHGGELPLRFAFAAELLTASMIVFCTWLAARLEERSFLSYGWIDAQRVARCFGGAVSGFLAISALVATLWKLGYLHFDGRVGHGAAAAGYGVGWAVMFVFVAIYEEMQLRGYLQFTLARGIGFWWSALLLSFLFGLIHMMNPGESWLGLVSAGFVGLVFCLSLWYTGSLWWALGFHAAWDWGQSFFYGTADSGVVSEGRLFVTHPVGDHLWSGGTSGPEGSVLVLPLLMMVALLMAAWWERRVTSPFAGNGWRPRRKEP